MHIISKKKLREFWADHSDAEVPLLRWFRMARHAVWSDLASLQRDFPHADVVGIHVIVNVAGNTFRLIAEVDYEWRKVFVRAVLTHREYDEVAEPNRVRPRPVRERPAMQGSYPERFASPNRPIDLSTTTFASDRAKREYAAAVAEGRVVIPFKLGGSTRTTKRLVQRETVESPKEMGMAIENQVISDAYLDLIREHPLRPVRSEDDLKRAIAMLDRLMDRGAAHRSEGEKDYMLVLGLLVEEYENVQLPMPSELEEREVLRLHHEAWLATDAARADD